MRPSVGPTSRPPNSPMPSAATATPSTTLAVTGCEAIRDGASVAPSRTAAIGGTLVALRAGEIVASIVMPTPISSDTTTVRVCRTVPFVGRSTPTALKNAFRPFASRKPQNSPMIAATRPVMKPSSSTERLTCLRDAPRVRSVASSRTRCATVIDSVLKMTERRAEAVGRRSAQAERQQEVLDDGQSVVRLPRNGRTLLGAGPHDGGVVQQRPHVLRHGLVADAALRRDEDRVELSLLVQHRLRRRHVEDREGRSADGTRPSHTSRCRPPRTCVSAPRPPH